jgi:thiamine-phosphate pyrophosphorylase
MKLVVISPESDHPSEHRVLGGLFAAGLERYHVRKPAWSCAQLEAWLHAAPTTWHPRLVLHSHHELVSEFGLGGIHQRDTEQLSAASPALSRSCHDLPTLRQAIGGYDSVFFGPIFPSISKPGYGPRNDKAATTIAAFLAARGETERRTSVIALGGITPERVPAVRALGFDGVAVIGAVWQAVDPLRAFAELQESLCCHAV